MNCCHQEIELSDEQIINILEKADRLLWDDEGQRYNKLYRIEGRLAALKAAVAMEHKPEHWASALRQVNEALVEILDSRNNLYSIIEQLRANFSRKQEG